MAYLPEEAVWEEGIYQYEATDKLKSGAGQIDNWQGEQLANRTVYLKEKVEEESENREAAVEDLQQQVDTMKGRGGYLTAYDFGTATPTQDALTQYALGQINQTDQGKIWNGTHVKNLSNSHVWVLTNTPDTEPPIFEWSDDGFDSIGIGNNEGAAGVVSGGLEFDSVYIDPQGKMRVQGLKAFQSDQVEGMGRDLLNVLGVNTIQAAMAALQEKCNGTGTPDFSDLMVGDYINGIDLSAIPAVHLNLTHKITSGTPGKPAEYITSSGQSISF